MHARVLNVHENWSLKTLHTDMYIVLDGSRWALTWLQNSALLFCLGQCMGDELRSTCLSCCACLFCLYTVTLFHLLGGYPHLNFTACLLGHK